jgi:hypothetical protein
MPIFDPNQTEGFLIGTLLGDSYMYRNYSFCCENVSKGLIMLKIKYLKTLLNKKVTLLSRDRNGEFMQVGSNKPIVNIKRIYGFSLHSIEHFSKFKSIVYPNSKRELSSQAVEKLTPAGLAVWFMDDGYLHYSASNCTRYLRICTDSFSIENVEKAIEIIKDKWGLESKIYWHKSGKDSDKKPRISFNAKNAQKLVSLIFPYMLPEFYYKINLRYLEETLSTKRIITEYKDIQKYLDNYKLERKGSKV